MTSSPEGNDSALAAQPGSELARARTEALNIVQWLARIANSYVTSDPAERRIELDFCAEDAAFTTKNFDAAIALQMRLPDLHMQFLHNGKPVPHVFDPQEHSPAEAEAWILVELLHRGIDREKFSKQLPYAIADLLTGDAVDYAPQACREGLVELTAMFRKAAPILKHAARASGAQSAFIALPQTLDLTLAPSPGTAPCMLGFSPGDAQNPAPFFYAETNRQSPRERSAVVSASALLDEKDAARAAAKLLEITAR